MKRKMIVEMEIEIDQAQIDTYMKMGLAKNKEEAEIMFCKVQEGIMRLYTEDKNRVTVRLAKSYNLNLDNIDK